ncbi:hypothetical protein C9374_004797 [Naegleria lovaniensis]|uniref:Amino acid transporter transmembrane domain-containing protein n=1 Tax=Naegleria lovaniensis TaxID=51637 RepID=A0AA88GRN0_NAELO|nr:uncharacterized protein C9374_004797 [Naegleria lovaniensis]KAG2382830.1 hypothetical protein C9374_004797 [Naegleria lovaniensis]
MSLKQEFAPYQSTEGNPFQNEPSMNSVTYQTNNSINHISLENDNTTRDEHSPNDMTSKSPQLFHLYEEGSSQHKKKRKKKKDQSLLAQLWSNIFNDKPIHEEDENSRLIWNDDNMSDRSMKSLVNINENHFVPQQATRTVRKKKKQNSNDFPLFSRKTNLFFTCFNLVNDILSPGTLAMPQMVAQSGIWMSILCVVFFGLITSFTLILLYEMSRGHFKTSLASLSEKAFGKTGNVITCIFIFLFNFGGACGMYIMFGDVMGDLLLYLFNNDTSNIFISRTAILLYLTAFLIPIALMKNLSSFAFTSFISVSCVLIITGLIILEVVLGRRIDPRPDNAFSFMHDQVLSALAALSFIYVSHDIVFHCFGEMKRPTRKRFYTVVFTVITLTILTIFAIGLSGYFLFYNKNLKDANILDLLPRRYSFAIVARLLLVLDISLSIPYALFMPRDGVKMIISTLVPRFAIWIKQTKLRREVYHTLVTLSIVALTLTVGLSVTDLGMFSDICGGVSATSLAYIIPPALFLKLDPWKGCCSSKGGVFRTAIKILCIIVLVIGVSVFASSIFSVIYHAFILHDA